MRSRFAAHVLLGVCCLLAACSTALGDTIVIPTVLATTAADRTGFVGTYTPSSGCVSSATCCCSTAPLVITASPTVSNGIVLAGATDGGAGCLGQTVLGGAFTLYNPLAAYSYLDVIPVLFELQTESTNTWLQLNTTKTTCNIVFQRTSTIVSNPTTTTSTATAAASSTGVSDPLAALFPGLNLTGLPTLGSNPLNLTLPSTPFTTNGGLTALPANPFSTSTTLPTPPLLPGQTAPTTTNTTNTTTGGVAYTAQLVEAKSSGAATGSRNYLASFIVPATSNVKFVILHYFTTADMRQQNVYMNLTTSTSLATQLLAAAPSGSVATAASYFIFAQGPINVEDTDAITYSYTYSTKDDGSNAFNTAAYTYSESTNATTAAQVTIPTDAVASLSGYPIVDTIPTADTTNINTNSVWNGQFRSDSSCVPSDTCCCGVGVMNVSTTLADPTKVLLSGALDGGAGCLYQNTITGLMTINTTDSKMASRSITIPNANKTTIIFTAALSTPLTASGTSTTIVPNSQLTIWNSFRPCQTVALKIGAYNPGGTPTTNTTTDTTLPRDAFIGEYDFDSSCVPSTSCCCAQGALAISEVNASTVIPPMPAALASLVTTSNTTTSVNYSQEILFTTSLDGGSACVGMTGVAQVFDISSTVPTVASWAVPPILSLSATLSSSGSNSTMDMVTFKNSMYPTCISTAKKRATVVVTPPVDNTTDTTPTVLTADQLTAARALYLGDYDSSGCVVSSTCCCTSGITTITANSTGPGIVNVATTLAGSGFSCLQQDGAQNMVFKLVNATAAEATPFAASTVQFWATMGADSKILVSNTVHPLCPTTLVKRAPIAGKATVTQHSNAALVVALAALAATLAVYTR